MAALTVTRVSKTNIGAAKLQVFTAPVGTYATNGQDLTAATLGLLQVFQVLVENKGGYTFDYDYANQKVRVYQGDNTNAAAAPSIEVPNATNLAAIVIRIFVIGR